MPPLERALNKGRGENQTGGADSNRTDLNIKEDNMALEKGERYGCPDAECGCEIEVTKGAAEGKGGDQNPRCCCGKEMRKIG